MRSFCQAVQVTIMALSVVLSLSLTCAMAQSPDAEAFLGGLSQNPVVISPGSGEFTATYVEDATGATVGIDYTLTYRALKSTTDAAGMPTPGMATQAYIHIGKEWENGGAVAFLCSNLEGAPAGTPPCPQPSAAAPDATVAGTIVASGVLAAGIGEVPDIITAGNLAALRQIMAGGAAYVNLHTVAHPTGELRGPIVLPLEF